MGHFDHKNPDVKQEPVFAAADDGVFPYAGVSEIYRQESASAKGWRFATLESGGHGFLYGDKGMSLLYEYLHKMMQ